MTQFAGWGHHRGAQQDRRVAGKKQQFLQKKEKKEKADALLKSSDLVILQ